jgi:hypothetical protein
LFSQSTGIKLFVVLPQQLAAEHPIPRLQSKVRLLSARQFPMRTILLFV